MSTIALTPEVLGLIAERLKGLAEPGRLHLLNALRRGERTVTELVAATGMTQANVSRHLRVLHDHGFVVRRKAGLHAFYAVADDAVFRICEVMCDRLDDEVEARRRMLAS